MFENLFKKTKEIFVDPAAAAQRVNCLNLVPATTQLQRMHCNMGDGREGDCLIYLKKAEKCRFHDPKYIPMSKEEIIQKVLNVEEDRAYRHSCLDAEVCPDCGHDLIIDGWGESEFTDGICRICQKSYILD